MAYSNRWTTTEQEPLRAIQSGQIGLYGELDPTDGGDTSRISLSARLAQSDTAGAWKANAYLVKYAMEPLQRFHLVPHRSGEWRPVSAARQSRLWRRRGVAQYRRHAVRPASETSFFQSRYDDITVVLNNTVARQFLSNILDDRVSEGNAGIYAENTVHWTNWLQHHGRLAGRLFRRHGEFHAAAGEFRP